MKSKRKRNRGLLKKPAWWSLGTDGSVIASVRADTKAEAREILKRYGEPTEFIIKGDNGKGTPNVIERNDK